LPVPATAAATRCLATNRAQRIHGAPWFIRLPYRIQGEKAQHAFWGLGLPRQSMLHQIALATG
jgi:hypothetical protein